ncbi:MAG: MmcQ/YjbR family DNA-binding protein [Jatrophihabitantaceae bacterium]
MTRDELIARALAFPAAVEDYPFGDDLLTVKVGGRVFAWIPLGESGWLGHGVRVAFKLPPQKVAELRSTYRDQVRAARPLDERYWLTIPIGAGIPDSEVADLLAASYEEVVRRLPKRSRPDRSD